MPDYRLLLDSTADVLVARARGFRNLVVGFVVIGGVSVGGAIALLSLRPISGLLLLVPAYGAFLWYDSRVLDRWRAQLDEAWAGRRIDFAAFRHAVNANRTLPQGTVQAMLETLPEAGDLTAEQALEQCTRQAVALALRARDDGHTSALACRAAAYAIAAAAVIASIMLWTWEPLLVIGSALVPWLGCHVHRRRRMTQAVCALRRLQERSDFDSEQYRTILGSLGWQGLPARDRDRLTALH